MAYTDIDKPSDYFNTKLYTGTGSTQSITGVGFQPDWVWIKDRDAANWNCLMDAVRGASKVIYSNESDAEATVSTLLTSFDSDGFSLGAAADGNRNTANFASWNWKAGGSASSNSNGSITTSISANQDVGFSIVSYTGNNSNGATIGHGLGATIDMVIIKKRSDTAQWAVGGTNIDSTFNGYLFLDDTIGTATSDNVFNDTAPSSSVVTLGTTGDSNASGQTYIAYCFAEKQGFSKFKSYTGNGSTNGTFVYTGFKPAFVLCKLKSADGYGWTLFDNKRAGFNELNYTLQPDNSNAQNTGGGNGRIDMLSNGFKLRTTDAGINGSGSTYIFMAFAENPFTTSTGVAGLAR